MVRMDGRVIPRNKFTMHCTESNAIGGIRLNESFTDFLEVITKVNSYYLEYFLNANTNANYEIINNRIFGDKILEENTLDFDVYTQTLEGFKLEGINNLLGVDVFAQLALNALGVLKKGIERFKNCEEEADKEIKRLTELINIDCKEENRGILISTDHTVESNLNSVYLEYIIAYGYPPDGIFDSGLIDEILASKES
tara:strand:+ start:649 stop:1239 length:591 start_codon:yes stop_codon:yes gene_type:complete